MPSFGLAQWHAKWNNLWLIRLAFDWTLLSVCHSYFLLHPFSLYRIVMRIFSTIVSSYSRFSRRAHFFRQLMITGIVNGAIDGVIMIVTKVTEHHHYIQDHLSSSMLLNLCTISIILSYPQTKTKRVIIIIIIKVFVWTLRIFSFGWSKKFH